MKPMVMQPGRPDGENHPRCGFAEQPTWSEPTSIEPRFKVDGHQRAAHPWVMRSLVSASSDCPRDLAHAASRPRCPPLPRLPPAGSLGCRRVGVQIAPVGAPCLLPPFRTDQPSLSATWRHGPCRHGGSASGPCPSLDARAPAVLTSFASPSAQAIPSRFYVVARA